ncbi:MAG: hypothetical protein V1910_02105 [bacterium]
MEIDQNQINNQNIQSVNTQFNNLLNDIKKINQNIDGINKEIKKDIDKVNIRINKLIKNTEQICFDLDQIEKNTNDKLDKLILSQMSDLTSE